MFDYVQIAGLILYFLALRGLASEKLSPLQAATIVVLGTYAVSAVVRMILLSSYGSDGIQLFVWSDILMLIIQLIISLIIFHHIEQRDLSYFAWLVWGLVGYYILFIALPSLV